MLKQKQKISDAELVVLALGGEIRYFAQIIDRYEPRLLRYIRRISAVSKEDAEDILQEVFVKVYLNLASFDENMSFSAWIYRITRNETISFYRKSSVRAHGNSIELSEVILTHLIDENLDIVQKIEKKELLVFLKKAIYKLPLKYREVIILRFFEDMSYLEISDILKVSTGTVSTLISRAKKNLKKIIKNYE